MQLIHRLRAFPYRPPSRIAASVTGRIAVILVSGALVAPTPLAAGPWPRDDGSAFLSFTQNYEDGAVPGYSAAYAEYGVNRRVTLVLRFGKGNDAERSLTAALRLPFGSGAGPHLFAGELGVGVRRPPRPRPAAGVLRGALHWGRGFASRMGNGWASAELSAERRKEEGRTVRKLDMTVGLNLPESRHVIGEVRLYRAGGRSETLLAASFVTPVRKGVKVQLGVTYNLDDTAKAGIFTAGWLEF